MKQKKHIWLYIAIFFILLLIIAIAFLLLPKLGINLFPFTEENNTDVSKVAFVDNLNTNEINNQNNVNTQNFNTSNNIDNSTAIDIATSIAPEDIPDYDFYFELPISGSTGYASINMNMVEAPNSTKIIKKLSAGDAFEIIEEQNGYLKIKYNNTQGLVNATYCMINLPDVIPSIIYDDTNSYSSIFKSSGYNIPNITGKQLYNVYFYNERLKKEEYVMPVIYSMAKKVMTAQKAALKDGYSLKIYETYRPYETQQSVCTNLKALLKENKTVYDGIYSDGWSEDWFINQAISSHQRGIAMDVSLVKIKSSKVITVGKYYCLSITKYSEEQMPTSMHELSKASATFEKGVATYSKTAWKNGVLSKSMTTGAKRLQQYCTNAGLTPLSSEWWHFNDLDSRNNIGDNYSTGKYKITKCLSTLPL